MVCCSFCMKYLFALLITLSLFAQTNQRSDALIDESAPYLQQHAYNPVQWYPLG